MVTEPVMPLSEKIKELGLEGTQRYKPNPTRSFFPILVFAFFVIAGYMFFSTVVSFIFQKYIVLCNMIMKEPKSFVSCF